MTRENSDVAHFRVMVRDAVIAQLAEQPLGFRHNDVADRIGGQYRAGGTDERRLRHQLQALCKIKLLNAVDHGIFVGGQAYVPGELNGLEPAIYKAFYEAGGSLSLPELMESLIGYDASDRVVARLLRGRPDKYFRGIPLPGWKQQWFLTDLERAKVPLPGGAQMLEFRILQLRKRASVNVNLVPLLDSFRKRVGSAIHDARVLRGLSQGHVLADPILADRLARCLSACRSRISDPVLGGLYKTVADWWKEEAQYGLSNALEAAWDHIEWDGASAAPWLVGVVDVAFWDALGAAFKANAALLSRGVVTSQS